MSVDPDVKPIPLHCNSALVPGFELFELFQTSLTEEELIQLAKTDQSLLNPRHLGRINTESVDEAPQLKHLKADLHLGYSRDSSAADDSTELDT